MVISLLFPGLISVLLLWPQNRGGLESESTASDQEEPTSAKKTREESEPEKEHSNSPR